MIKRDGTYRERLVAQTFFQDSTCKDNGRKARQPSDGCRISFSVRIDR